MALIALLRNLQGLHGWRLSLWHGDHGWRCEASAQAAALANWAQGIGLPCHGERADPAPASEAEARTWRYSSLRRQAEALGCSHVLTAHTATDRAETLLLNLARGSYRRGLASLRATRPLAPGIQLVRPLLPFTREDTARICQQMGVPVWVDPTNADPRYSRNRVRAQVLPVLESLHPGATARMASLAERLVQEEEQAQDLAGLALLALTVAPERRQGLASLARRPLAALQPATQRLLLQQWLRQQWGRPLEARTLELLLARLPLDRGPGRQDLAQGWHLQWDGSSLHLIPPPHHGELS